MHHSDMCGVSNDAATTRFRLPNTTSRYDLSLDGYRPRWAHRDRRYPWSTCRKNGSNENKYQSPKWLFQRGSYINATWLMVICACVETYNPDVNMKAEILAMHYGMSVDRSQKSYVAFGW